ncbi:thermonuclease family protein [Naasia sp. SYSU D00057]|uniref:thermonuclease family protein n=1 Tax=Naasia sp. SYSU D00057 TaxID=2817380 RepID=UPI001B308332|nr:thermonuclease family protein [Naasia sp. SYSU D00057]
MGRARRRGARRRVLSAALAAAAAGAALAGCDVVTVTLGSDGTPTTQSPSAGQAEGTPAVVERVVDGDTVIVDLDGERQRVRLLNIDTPESVAEDRPVECLGPEASELAADLLPAGAEVTLVFDEDRFDDYDRMLAAVYTEDGRNVSVELARAGLAEAITVQPNDRFRPEVQEAMEEAQDANRGLWDPSLPCA